MTQLDAILALRPRLSASGLGIAGLRPAVLVWLFSLVFGTLMIAVTPPLRGPDETAHFVRAYGLSQGIVIPRQSDTQSRKGIEMPATLFDGFRYFETVRTNEKTAGFSYAQAFRNYAARPGLPEAATDGEERTVFVRYEGSEGYSPVAYLPQAAAAFISRAIGLDFLATQYAMRFAGLVAMTAVIAAAVAMAGPLGWAFLAIAMLPAALYGRATINADGAAFAFALMVAALAIRGSVAATSRSLPGWTFLCVLAKPSNIAFLALDVLRRPLRSVPRQWPVVALIALPALAGALVWTLLSSGDVAAWRLVELTGTPIHEFDPVWKLGYLAHHPLHFPGQMLGMLQVTSPAEFGRQIIGVLGLFDVVLARWTYPAIALLMLATFFVRLDMARRDRLLLARAAGLTTLGYALLVVFIFYLIWTPVGADDIWGVQGRYLVPALPLVAMAVAALVNRGPGLRFTAVCALSAATLSGIASAEAALRSDWAWRGFL